MLFWHVQGLPLSPPVCGYYSSHHGMGRAEEHRQEHNEATELGVRWLLLSQALSPHKGCWQ